MSDIGVNVVTPPIQNRPTNMPLMALQHLERRIHLPHLPHLFSSFSCPAHPPLQRLFASRPLCFVSAGVVFGRQSDKTFDLRLLHIAPTTILRQYPTIHSTATLCFCSVPMSFLPSPPLAVSLLELVRTTHGCVVQVLEVPGIRKEIGKGVLECQCMPK